MFKDMELKGLQLNIHHFSGTISLEATENCLIIILHIIPGKQNSDLKQTIMLREIGKYATMYTSHTKDPLLKLQVLDKEDP